jgi:hypothetical protein
MTVKVVTYQHYSPYRDETYEKTVTWELQETVYCPFCGNTECVWKNTSMEWWEDNIGDCHLCTKCKAAYHVSDYKDYIDEINQDRIAAILLGETNDLGR